jgi:hypothetical protein
MTAFGEASNISLCSHAKHKRKVKTRKKISQAVKQQKRQFCEIGTLLDDNAETSVTSCGQGCQMVCFQTKNPNLSKFWRV